MIERNFDYTFDFEFMTNFINLIIRTGMMLINGWTRSQRPKGIPDDRNGNQLWSLSAMTQDWKATAGHIIIIIAHV